MLNVDRMRLAGNVLDAAVKGLTDEEVGRMLLIHATGACMWVVNRYNENSKKEEEMNNVDEAVREVLNLLIEAKKKILAGLKEEKKGGE